MLKPFPYKRVLITGVSSGLGACVAAKLVGAGCEVWGTSRDTGKITVEGVKPLALDLTSTGSIEHFVNNSLDSLGPLDLLINNAGAGVFGEVHKLSPELTRQQLDLLLTGPILLAQAVLPGMLQRRRGCIANVSSLAAQFPLPFMTLYSSSKAGLSAFSRSLAREMEGQGVHVVDFQPGDFQTNFNTNMRREGGNDRIWGTLEHHLSGGPDVGKIADKLIRALRKERSGTWVEGTFFQARLAPLGPRLLPAGLLRAIERRYHRIDS